jgi:hypothetical protein
MCENRNWKIETIKIQIGYIFSWLKKEIGWLRVRVARWFIFKPKIPIWVNFARP